MLNSQPRDLVLTRKSHCTAVLTIYTKWTISRHTRSLSPLATFLAGRGNGSARKFSAGYYLFTYLQFPIQVCLFSHAQPTQQLLSSFLSYDIMLRSMNLTFELDPLPTTVSRRINRPNICITDYLVWKLLPRHTQIHIQQNRPIVLPGW